MAGNPTGKECEHDLQRLAALLDQARFQRCTLTYLEVADQLAVPGPNRIQKIAHLLEMLLEQDANAGRPIRAALVTSRARPGLPAEGFFECARRLGLYTGNNDDEAFHSELLADLLSDDRS